MSLLLSGRVSKIETRPVLVGTANEFVETTIVVQDWGQTFYVTKNRDFEGDLPVVGDEVTLSVSVRAYVNKSGKPGFSLHARGVVKADAAAGPTRIAAV